MDYCLNPGGVRHFELGHLFKMQSFRSRIAVSIKYLFDDSICCRETGERCDLQSNRAIA